MKNLFAAVLFIVLFALSPAGHARQSVPVESPQHVDFVASASRPGLDRIRQSILAAASGRCRDKTAERPGELTLHNLVRNKHTVVINAFYDAKGVRAEYVSSNNMNYEIRNNVAYIHLKYNEWVKLLLKDIVVKTSS